MSDSNTSNDHLLQAIALLMSPRGITIEDLADELGVSVRTGFRIKKLILKHFPNLHKYKENRQSYYQLFGSDILFPTVDIQPYHVANLDAIIRKTTDRDHKESLEKMKIFALTLVKKSRAFYTDYKELYETEINSFQPYIKLEYEYSIVETIRNAILTCNTVDISYIKRSNSEAKLYKNYTPLGIIWGVRNYLLTRPLESEKEPFLLALTNIQEITQNKESFSFPEDHNIKNYVQNMFGVYNEDVKDYELIFKHHKTMGNINEYHLHNSQTMTILKAEEPPVIEDSPLSNEEAEEVPVIEEEVLAKDEKVKVKAKKVKTKAKKVKKPKPKSKKELEEESLLKEEKILINDDETLVKFQASGLHEVFNFIIQWEDKVKIIAPQELKDKVSRMKLPIVDNTD